MGSAAAGGAVGGWVISEVTSVVEFKRSSLQLDKKMFLLLLIIIQVVLASSLENSKDVISTNVTLTKFYLWTRQNPSVEQELIWGDLPSIVNSNFESSKPTKVLVHVHGEWETTVGFGYKRQLLKHR